MLGEDDERPITPPPGSNLRFSRSDNGPEFLAKAVQEWIAVVGAKTAYIERGSPWENGYIESFNARLRDELLDGEIFYTLREAQIVIESWRRHYNMIRPHASLGYKPPAPEVFVPTFAAYLDHSAGADQLPARAQRHRDYARLQAQRKPQPQDQNRARCRLRYRTRVIAPPRQNGSPHYNDEDRAREQIGVGNARKHLLEGRSPADGGTNCFGMLLRETGHSRVPAPPHMITGMI